MFEQPRSAGGAHAFGDDHVLDGQRHASQQPRILAGRQFLVHGLSGRQRALRREMQIRVGFRIFLLRKLERGLRQLDRAERPLGETFPNLWNGERGQVRYGCAHRSITLGTL